MLDIKQELGKVMGDYSAFSAKQSTAACWKLSLSMQDLENALREDLQSQTKPQIGSIVAKLEDGEPLSPQDRDFLRLWIVGDSDYYLALENDFSAWTAELERLMEELRTVSANRNDIAGECALRARLLDGIRVLGDILFFLQQKERVASFVESTAEINPAEADLLVQILRGKANSKEN